ncbi:hypothetical protein L195_g019377 [Trifolium pratense]|uniref:Uncharacterized protein n=1 Tax=Trifolium pratense TaxID=57577 RepID=A0A2K3MZF4_TRIPR|nr:hypothetical protein L195_g019377 [Trifolium pratense]
MRKRSTQSPDSNEEEENALDRSIVRSTRPRIGSVPKTNNQPNTQFEFNMMGNMTDCLFYVPDVAGDCTGLAFRVAYDKAKSYDSNKTKKQLCSYVGSMLCAVIPGFRNSVETALKGIGIRPEFVSLPSQARKINIVISEVPQLDWSSILVIFGYCVLLLFKVDNEDFFCFKYMCLSRPSHVKISKLKEKLGCSSYLNIPFNENDEYAIRTMLGTRHLRETVITFLMNKFDHPDSQICSLCQYLSNTLSWSGDMRVFAVINERLIKTKSPVLSHSAITAEVDNLEETMKAIGAHTYPHYFSHLCSDSELFHLDVSRFRTLFAVALDLDRTFDSSYANDYSSADVSEVNHKAVKKLLELHWEASSF